MYHSYVIHVWAVAVGSWQPEDNFRQAAAPHAKRPPRQPRGHYSRDGQGRRRITGDMGMASAARDRLGKTLRGDSEPAPSTERTVRMDALTLDVEGFGRAKFP